MIARILDNGELSRYFASFCGMDGGNLQAKLWICGIEHGSKADELSTVTPECEPGEWAVERKNQYASEYRKWPYWRNVAKVVIGTQRAVRTKRGLADNGPDWRTYRDKYLYSRLGWEFKLNLFPLPTAHVSSEDWAKAYGEQPALAEKEHYRTLCRKHGRFEFTRALCLRHRPKVILATGISSRDDFSNAFGFDETRAEDVVIGSGKSERHLSVFPQHYSNGGHGVLIVTPFLGSPSGINSNALLDELAGYLASWLAPDDFPSLKPTN